jgi:hypothetical protein
MMLMTRRLAGMTLAFSMLAVVALATSPQQRSVSAEAPFGFGAPIVIDQGRAGGEPIVTVDRKGTWLYSSHAGTTHFYKQAAANAADFLLPYAGQTYLYRCTAGSAACASNPSSWQFVSIAGTGLHTVGTGFSDPDIAFDAAGKLYHTEISLASTDVNTSTDDGATWSGNPLAPAGDRPWLAADGKDVLYLAIDPVSSSHTVYTSTDGGQTFNKGVVDSGTLPDGRTITANGKMLVDPRTHAVYEPAWVYDANGNVNGVGIGVSRDGGATFTQHLAANDPVYRTFWGMLTQDAAGTLYLFWDQADNLGAYSQRHSIAIRYAYSRDGGTTWSRPGDVARPKVATFWPWAVGGAGGTVGVAWYQSDKPAIPESESSSIGVYAAQILDADTPHPGITTVNASGKPTHTGTVCQDGTACNAQLADDRRLGEYLTCALDPAGHLVIAYSDTVAHPDSPVSRPGLVVQTTGRSFLQSAPAAPSTGGTRAPTAATPPATLPNTSGGAGRAAGAGALLVGCLLAGRRRRRPAPTS